MRAGTLVPATRQTPSVTTGDSRYRSMRAGTLVPATLDYAHTLDHHHTRSMRAGTLVPATPSDPTRPSDPHLPRSMRAGTLVPATRTAGRAVVRRRSTLNEGRNFSSGNTLQVLNDDDAAVTLNEGRNFSSGNTPVRSRRHRPVLVRSMRAGTLVPATR